MAFRNVQRRQVSVWKESSIKFRSDDIVSRKYNGVLFFLTKFCFFLQIFLWARRMVVIFSRTRRAMFGETFRYLEHLHTTSEKFSRATWKKVFRWKSTFSKICIRIFWELDTLKNSIFSVLVAYLLIYASYDRHFFRGRVELC